MQEKPLAEILDRKKANELAAEHFKDQIELLQDLTNYGSNLVFRAFNSSPKDYPSIVVCGILLKQIVAMLDAVHVLMQEGAIHASYLPARTAFEASIYLDWILFSDNELKAMAYIVSNFRDERIWCTRVIKGTPEEKIFDSLAKGIGLDIHARRPTLTTDAQKRLVLVRASNKMSFHVVAKKRQQMMSQPSLRNAS